MVHTLLSVVTADSMNKDGRQQKQPADDNPSSQHEYNYFLDKEIQRKLLGISDSDAYSPWGRDSFRNPTPILTSPPKSQRSRLRNIFKEELCGWTDAAVAIATVPESAAKKADKLVSQRTNRDKESSLGWKDQRVRDITYDFKHYGDVTRYMEQYRYEHTYNFGPLGREPIEITTCKIIPLRDNTPTPVQYAERHHNPLASIHPPNAPANKQTVPSDQQSNTSDNKSSDKIGHSQSEPNILELAHKYKFAPSVLKEARAQRSSSPSSSTSPSGVKEARSHKRLSSPSSLRSVSQSESVRLPSTLNSGQHQLGAANNSVQQNNNNDIIRVAPSVVALGRIYQAVPTTGAHVTQHPVSPRGSDASSRAGIRRISNESPLTGGPVYTKIKYRSQSLSGGSSEKAMLT